MFVSWGWGVNWRGGREQSGWTGWVQVPTSSLLDSRWLFSGTARGWNLHRCGQLCLWNLKFGFQSHLSQCLHRCHLDESLECLRVQTMVSSTPCQSPYAFTAFRKRTRHSDSFGQDWQIHCPASLGGPHPFLPHILLFQEQSPCSWSLCSHVAINQQQLLFPPPGLRSGNSIEQHWRNRLPEGAFAISWHWAFQMAQWVKNPPDTVGDAGWEDPRVGRCPAGGHGNPLQYFCLENPMDRGAWWATVHGVAKSWTCLSRQQSSKDREPVSSVAKNKKKALPRVLSGNPRWSSFKKLKPQSWLRSDRC